MRLFLFTLFFTLSILFTERVSAQGFPNPTLLSTGQGPQGSLDPIWLVSGWYASPPNPMGLPYTSALISNNCAPGAWVNPGSLPPPVNNGNWITNPSYPCSSNTIDGYIYFRLPLVLPPTCDGVSISSVGSYSLSLTGYVDNTITDVFVNGTSTGFSGGNYSWGGQLNFTLTGPWIAGTNYVDVQVYNFPNGGNSNPYGLLLVANTSGSYPNGCPPSITGDTVICLGQSTTLLVAEAGYSYQWSTGATTNSIIVSPSVATTYSVTVSNTYGYTASSTTHVLVNPLPTPSVTPLTQAVCPGDSATLTASGGVSYQWSNHAATTAITVSPAVGNTTYTVTATDANLCSNTASAMVTVYSPPTPFINPSTTQICINQSVVLTAFGGGSYAWSNAASTAAITVSPLSTSSYTVTVTDAHSCTAFASATVTVNPLPTPAITLSSAQICIGNKDTLTAGGGVSYVWSNATYNAVLVVSPTITTPYSVTVTDAHSCTASTSATVIVNPLPTPLINPAVAQICKGNSMVLTASGGVSYAWDNSANTAAITVSPAADSTYTVTVTDANSCSATASKTVIVHPLPTPSVNPAATQICLNQSTVLTASGGVSYAWSNADNTAAITVSPATITTYTVTVTDANTCSATAEGTVTVNPLPTPAITLARAQICFGNSDTLTASGGLSYAWSNAANTDSIIVSPGTTTPYSVTATDVNHCTASATNTVIVNPLPIPVINPAVAQICIGKSGTLTATGGVSYTWDNSANTAAITVSPLADSTYTVTVTDANNCSATASKTMIVNPLPTPSVTPAATQICLNQSTVLTASGGASYAWSNAANTASNTVSPTTVTTYTVTVTDANTCSATASGTVTVNPLPIPVIVPLVAQICQGYSDTLTASGGAGYVWSTSATTATIIVAPAATTTYSVVVTDTNNCSNSTSGIVTVIPYMALTIDSTNITCNGAADGTTTLTVASGLPPYSYRWSTNATSLDLSDLTPGPYTVTVTDDGGCTATASASISQPLPLALTSSYINPTCPTFINGNISISITGGTLPYQYNWSNSALGADLTDIGPGSYSVLVTDANNCTVGSGFSLSYIYDFSVHATTPSDSVYLGDTTTISYSVTGNYGAGFTSIWSPAYGLSCTSCVTAVAAPDVSTLYQITITNDTGCISTDTLTIYVIPDYSIYVPNVFTPNGDHVNDYFQIFGKLNSLSYLEMRVFDRWGELVFRSNDIYFAWDGTFKGAMEDPGLFIWQLNLTFINGHSEYKKGSLTLIR